MINRYELPNPRPLTRLTSERRVASTSIVCAWYTSSDASSSISVVSVPLDVTGDGPTMSLGLKMCIELEDTLLTEFGLSEAESVAGGGDELIMSVSARLLLWQGC